MVRLFRELDEMRYLWETPVRLDNTKLVALLGAEPRTPLDVAIRTTLVAIGCLPQVDAPRQTPEPSLSSGVGSADADGGRGAQRRGNWPGKRHPAGEFVLGVDDARKGVGIVGDPAFLA